MNTFRGISGILLIVASVLMATTSSNVSAMHEITFAIMGVGGLILIGQIQETDPSTKLMKDFMKARLLLNGVPPDLIGKIGKDVVIKKDAEVYMDHAGTDLIKHPQRNGMVMGYKGDMVQLYYGAGTGKGWIKKSSIV